MAPEMASSVVFAALERLGTGDLPATRDEAVRFSQGALKDELEARFGKIHAAHVTVRVQELLARATPKSESAAMQTTLKMKSVEGPVSVLVLSLRTALGVRLRAVLGGERVTVHVVSSIERALDGMRRAPPDVVVLDGELADTLSPEQLDAAGKGVPSGALLVLWESEAPQAEATQRRLRRSRPNLVPINRKVGVDPLLDVIKARRSPA